MPPKAKALAKQHLGAATGGRCKCGNFCGEDGLCNACRSAKAKAAATEPASAPAAGFAPAPRPAPKAPKAPRKVPVVPPGGHRTRAEAISHAVLACCPETVEDDMLEYLSDTAVTLFEDEGMTPKVAREELEASFLPILEDAEVSAELAAAFCEAVVSAAFPPATPAKGRKAASTAASAADPDLILRMTNMLLMYGGSTEPLLRNTQFELVRGHRYGVVGANGSGKTTLMSKLGQKDVAGLPPDLRVVHLRHETFLDGVAVTTTAIEYARMRCGLGLASDDEVVRGLTAVGFDEEFLEKPVVTLSGGWQMRLGLACAMVQKASLFLLDEPTNHLDVAGVAWLVSFINRTCIGGEAGSTAMIVSHDQSFLDLVCTDVIHFTPNGKLAYHPGNFARFKESELGGDDAEAQRLLETSSLGMGPDRMDRMNFTQPERLGSAFAKATSDAPVLRLTRTAFQHPGAARPVFEGVHVKMTLNSKVGIVGKNGSGKSTLLSLLAGRLHPSTVGGVTGELWNEKGLRLAYIAQHSLVHLGEHLSLTPVEYMQLRYRRGYDAEAPHALERPLTKEQLLDIRDRGSRHGNRGKNVEAILGRLEGLKEGDELQYEVSWEELGPSANSFVKEKRLKQLGVLHLVHAFNERLYYAWAGAQPRPLTKREIIGHLEPYGLSEEILDTRKIGTLSSGQRCKLAFGAAFWTRPHIVCLDEPTNYLDPDTVELLQRALQNFKGGCAIVTHNEKFVEEVCNEVWEVADGKVVVRKLKLDASAKS